MDREEIKLKYVDMLHGKCEAAVEHLFEIWNIVGKSDVETRLDIVCQNVEQILKDMVAEEHEYRRLLVTEIEELLQEASNLSEEVGADHMALISGLEDSRIPLISVKETLNDRLKNCRAQKQERMQKYQELLAKEEQLTKSLGLKKKPRIPRVPRDEDLENFSTYLSMKSEEERELRQLYEETKLKIEMITAELGVSPVTSFHKILVSSSEFRLSNENMMLLKELHQDMEQRLEKAKSLSIELREKLSNLWGRLQIDYKEREQFLMKYPGHSMTTIEALKCEIKRCEDEKRLNIRRFVETIREELSLWWDKCCFGVEQRQLFRSYYSDCYTEDLLELHELEIEKLRTYYEENTNILELAKKREKLWTKMIDLNERAHDPQRLFANRGGQLLREEKARKAIQKDLPIIDAELKILLDAYMSQHNAPFLYDGVDLRDIIKSKWDDFRKRKEEEKLARKKGRDHTTIDKTLSATKRKMPVTTPASIPSKVTKVTSSAMKGGEGPSTASQRSVPSGSKVVRKIFEIPVNGNPGITTRSRIPRIPCIQPVDASYAGFEDGLEKRVDKDMVRSSVVPSHLLKEKNGRAGRADTPVKPPRKNSITRSCTNLSEFRTPQAVRAASPGLSRSRSAPRLTTARVITWDEEQETDTE